jgi:hypothetical protein
VVGAGAGVGADRRVPRKARTLETGRGLIQKIPEGEFSASEFAYYRRTEIGRYRKSAGENSVSPNNIMGQAICNVLLDRAVCLSL